MSTTSTAETTPSGAATVADVAEFTNTPQGKFKLWQAELDTAGKPRKDWFKRGDQVVRRYRDERDAVNNLDRRFNILWSNVQVLRSALYNKPPKPDVSRKFDTSNPVNRVAAQLLFRNLEYAVCENGEFDAVMRSTVLDRLLPGQGTAWIRYSANIGAPEATAPPAAAALEGPAASPEVLAEAPQPEAPPAAPPSPAANQQLTDDVYHLPTEEKLCWDYVHWKDFLCSCARTWEEVTWVARRVFLTREIGIKRFGEKFKSVPLNYRMKEGRGTRPGERPDGGPGPSVVQKAAVWEIWDKTTRRVIWMCPDYTADILDEKSDLLELSTFFPCPKPLLATVTTDDIIPVPDYCMYQDQAQELDQITNRISLLTQALKVVGVYDKKQDSLQRLLTEGQFENSMIPVDNWAMFAERGGLKGVVDFFPVEQVMIVLEKLIAARSVVKQDIYEITGMADIVRGASVASESATAQNLKAKFADIRISDSQKDIARFAADLINMGAEVITNFFQPESIILGADMGDQNDPDAQYIGPAIQLIKSRRLIKHRITVSTDAITEQDKQEEQDARVAFLTALGQFMQQAGAVAEGKPELAPFFAQLMLWGVRGFRVGTDIEGELEQAIIAMQKNPPQPKQSPEEMKMAMEMKIAEGKANADAQARQQEGAQKAMLQQQEMNLKAQQQNQELAFKQKEFDQKLDFQEREFQQKLLFKEREHAMQMQQSQATNAAKVETAQIDGAVKMQSAAQDAEIREDQAEQDAAIRAQQAAQAPKDTE